MGYKLIAQMVLILAALVLIYAFIRPSFGEIQETQAQIYQYEETIDKAEQFNALLSELIIIRDSVPQESLRRLEQFIPEKIDTLQVMKDIETVFSFNDIELTSLTASEEVPPVSNVNFEGDLIMTADAAKVTYQDFELSFVTTYQGMKDILLYLEANASLLEIMELQFMTTTQQVLDEESVQVENDEYLFSMKLRTYGLRPSTN